MSTRSVSLEGEVGDLHLVVAVPPEQQQSIAEALRVLTPENDGDTVRDIILDALLTAAEQRYFWEPEWQAQEQAVDKALAQGEYKTFDSIEDMLDFLDQQ